MPTAIPDPHTEPTSDTHTASASRRDPSRAQGHDRDRDRSHPAWRGLVPYAPYLLVLAAHLVLLETGPAAVVYPSKLALMPVLAAGAIWASRGLPRSARAAITLLLLALGFSWLGDGAAFFFPFVADELPAMLACFGVAHVLYIVLFTRSLRGARDRARPPRWTLVYAAWWVVMIAALWPHLGVLAIGVALYGLVLGGTAVAAALGSRATALGGLLFLASDTLLALRLFLSGADAVVSDVAVMSTYGLGQGLLAAGVVALLRRASRRTVIQRREANPGAR